MHHVLIFKISSNSKWVWSVCTADVAYIQRIDFANSVLVLDTRGLYYG